MVLVILGVIKKKISKFSLFNYSLITQIIIINIITATIGFIGVCFFNFLLIKNNNSIETKINNINSQLEKITNYLENNAIIRIPQFNEDTGEIGFFSDLQLDPYISQNYIESKFLDQSNEIIIYNNDLIKYVDSKDLYLLSDVREINTSNSYKEQSFYQQYKKYYLTFYNLFHQYFINNKIKKSSVLAKNDISLILETIKKGRRISKIFNNDNKSFSFNVLNPIKNNDKIFGILLIRTSLNEENSEEGLISFSFFNLYLIIIFLMFFLSIFFTRSIIRPVKTLSFLVKAEQDKFNPKVDNLKYPIRNDEIGDLSNEIKLMSKELKSRINELEIFAADVSHELKNPLASLKTSNELLSGDKIKIEDRRLLFDNIAKDINRMNRLITDISEYTRIQAEVEKQKFKKFDFIKFIKELILSFEQNKKNIKFIFKSNKSEFFVKANLDKLAQVFINLIENAISFSPYESNILIDCKKSEKFVAIFLTDQGYGIEKKLQDKIFERFYTDRQNQSEFHTGLGLSISKKIMESFGGSIELCENVIKDYKGACFKLKLPIKD